MLGRKEGNRKTCINVQTQTLVKIKIRGKKQRLIHGRKKTEAFSEVFIHLNNM